MKTTLELLPTWEECDRTIKQLGPQGASALTKFINTHERTASSGKQFREQLAALIDEVAGVAVVKHYSLPFAERVDAVRGLKS